MKTLDVLGPELAVPRKCAVRECAARERLAIVSLKLPLTPRGAMPSEVAPSKNSTSGRSPPGGAGLTVAIRVSAWSNLSNPQLVVRDVLVGAPVVSNGLLVTGIPSASLPV